MLANSLAIRIMRVANLQHNWQPMYIEEGSNYDLESFEETVEEIKETIRDGFDVVNLGEKDGLVLNYVKGRFQQYVFLRKAKRKNGKIVGMISMSSHHDPKIGTGVFASYLRKKYRGQGLGTVMYLGAVHHLGKIHSSTCLGEMSLRTYKALRKFHKVDMYDMSNEKVRYSWNEKIPKVNGRRIDDVWDYYHFVVTK